MKKYLKPVLTTLCLLALFVALPLVAQDPTVPTDQLANETGEAQQSVTVWNIIYGGSLINLLIWILLFSTSIGAIAFIIDSVLTLKADKIMPRILSEAVHSSIQEGDLMGAIEACENNPSPLANILLAGLNNVRSGHTYSVVVDSVSSAAEIETEKMMQRVNYLNLCGALAPMLGLMGTVVGMVLAFQTLGQGGSSSNKAQMLATNISIALYTTLYGLLVSVPAILGFTLSRNHANKLILSMEMLTYDLIKDLESAQVVEE